MAPSPSASAATANQTSPSPPPSLIPSGELPPSSLLIGRWEGGGGGASGGDTPTVGPSYWLKSGRGGGTSGGNPTRGMEGLVGGATWSANGVFVGGGGRDLEEPMGCLEAASWGGGQSAAVGRGGGGQRRCGRSWEMVEGPRRSRRSLRGGGGATVGLEGWPIRSCRTWGVDNGGLGRVGRCLEVQEGPSTVDGEEKRSSSWV